MHWRHHITNSRQITSDGEITSTASQQTAKASQLSIEEFPLLLQNLEYNTFKSYLHQHGHVIVKESTDFN